MNQIAKKAELGVATLYSYFKNKEDLYLAIQKEGFKLLEASTLEKVASVADPKEKLASIAQAFLEFSQEHKNYYYIINYYISSPEVLFEQNLKNEIDFLAENTLGITEVIIREGIEKGAFLDVDPRRSAIGFWAMVQGLTQFRKLESTIMKSDSYQDIFDYAVEQFIHSLGKVPS